MHAQRRISKKNENEISFKFTLMNMMIMCPSNNDFAKQRDYEQQRLQKQNWTDQHVWMP